MTLLRSLLFMLWMYGLMAVMGLLYLPFVLVLGRRAAVHGLRAWSRLSLFGLKLICGQTFEASGLDTLPRGAVLIAAKHQSMWETIFFTAVLRDPSVILKQELLAMPVYGWYAKKLDMIVIDRSKGAAALKYMLALAQRHKAMDRPIVIFPEGTRQAPGAPPDYKPGIAALYTKLDLPCYPVALNSGLFWSGILRRPGKVRIEILPPIPPGLDRKAFMAELEARIETASHSLCQTAAAPGAASPEAA